MDVGVGIVLIIVLIIGIVWLRLKKIPQQSHIVIPQNSLRYFYYISKTKIDMLLPQVRRTAPLSGISPKIELGVLSVGVDLAQNSNNDTISNTLNLLRELDNRSLVRDLNQTTDLNSNDFYYNQDVWYSGIFSFGALGGPPIATYIVWKQYGDSIVLLAGSPSNIIGEKVVNEGFFIPSTGGAWQALNQFVRANIETDEPVIQAYESDQRLLNSRRNTHNLPIAEIKDTRSEEALYNTSGEDYFFESFFHSKASANPNAVALGIFTLRYLSKLPQSKIETTFKIFRSLEVSRPEDLPLWAHELSTFSEHDNVNTNLWRYKTIYVGSPLYVALG